jgi:murein DD-endopeptidase MepM/ murein hydrolase activator NlpD
VLRAFLVGVALFLLGASTAAAYPWPVKPFNVQHPIRGNFDDPRARRGSIDAVGNNPLSFHSGVDIQAPDGTPVYAIQAGQVTFPAASAVSVGSPFALPSAPLVFGYWHVVPAVGDFQYVARGQLLGYVKAGEGHVHLSEKRFGQYVNPLRRGALAPYHDTTPPVIRKLVFYECGTATEIKPDAVSGCVDVAVDAYDPPPIPPQPPWSDVVVSPARISWTGLFGGAWVPLAYHAQSVDFISLLTIPLTDVYAPGTIMNGPNTPGDYRYWLAHNVNTTLLADGRHTIVVTASDVRDNTTTAALAFTVTN